MRNELVAGPERDTNSHVAYGFTVRASALYPDGGQRKEHDEKASEEHNILLLLYGL